MRMEQDKDIDKAVKDWKTGLRRDKRKGIVYKDKFGRLLYYIFYQWLKKIILK